MFPQMIRVKQAMPAPALKDISQEVRRVMRIIKDNNIDFKGLTVGITAGSRGISGIQEILRLIADSIKKAGGFPVLISAMGTHGGGTGEGQLEVLESLGIKEAIIGAPLRCSSETVLLGSTLSGIPVYCNLEATKVDRLIIVNRIKPHTDFSGNIESGICKMMAIGLGNPLGALTTHSHALVKGYEAVIKEVAQVMLQKLPVSIAIGILENWKGDTESIEGMLPEEIFRVEPLLLSKVKSSTIKLPFKEFDVLVIEEIGKNISGTGMDTKVVGRIMVKGQLEPDTPKIARIVVLNLTPESHGNAIGIGLADITTEQVLKTIDISSTSFNSISSMSPEQGRLPCIVRNDKEAIESAISTLGYIKNNQARIVYIKNTLKLDEFAVSEALLGEVKVNPFLGIAKESEELVFNLEDCLQSFWT